MFGASRGEAPAGLAARMSAAQDGFVDNTAFDAAFCDEPAFQISEGAPQADTSSALKALGDFDEGLTIFDAIEEADSITDTLLDPISMAVHDAAGIAWPTPYATPDYGMEGLGNAGTDDDLDFNRPTTASLDGLGAFAQTNPAHPKARAYRQVVAASAMPGTALAGKTAQALLQKSTRIADLADDRTRAATEAREGFRRTLKEIDTLDQRAALLARQLLDASGKPRADLTLLDIDRLKKLRARSLELGRRAIRYQKVNALATPLAQNAIAQADILQKMSAATLTGDTGAVAALGAMFEEIGKKSAQIRNIRQKQLSKWEKKGELSGFAGIASFRDPYEAGLNAIELADVSALAQLEGPLLRKLKKAGKKAFKAVVKPVAQVAQRAAKAAFVDPVKTTLKVARRAAHGDIRGAFKAVGSAVRTAAADVANIAGKTILDFPCKLASSSLGKAAMQAGGRAVGTAFAGPTGGAVGGEAGRQGGIMQASVCGAMKRIGVTEGTFRPGKVKGAFKDVARKLYKTTLSPQAVLRAASNIAQSGATGGALPGAGILQQFGSSTIQRLGISNLASQVQRQASQQILRQGQRLAAQQVQRAVGPAIPLYLQRAPAQAAPVIQNYIGRVGDFL